jgi:VWFA-related protein
MIVRLCIAVGLVAPLAAQEPPPSQPLLRIDVNLVQVDAVVTDSCGRHVPDLRREDFEIRQDGKLQDVSHLSFIADPSTPYVRNRKKAVTPELTFLPPPEIDATGIRRTVALVVDDLGLTFENIASVRDALRKFVDEEMQPGDLVAIITTGRGAAAFQQFTVDKRILRAAIEQVRFNFNTRAQSFTTVVDRGDREWEREHFTAGTLGALQSAAPRQDGSTSNCCLLPA